MMREQSLVHDMMVALELPLPNEDKPGLKNLNYTLLRKLVSEEADEFDDALLDLSVLARIPDPDSYDRQRILDKWAEAIDAMCDLIVVIHNTSNAMGIDLQPFFDEVHRTNMAKVGGPLNVYGKRMKPYGWQPPRIKERLLALLKEQQNE